MSNEFVQRQSRVESGSNLPVATGAQRMAKRANVLAERRRKIKQTFGETLRVIREATPSPDGTYKRLDCLCMTQSQLAEELSLVIEADTDERCDIDTSWINKVECGHVWLEPERVDWIARALRADEINTALLREAHGYHGIARLVYEMQGPVVVVASCFEPPESNSRLERRVQRLEGLAQARDLIAAALEGIQAELARKRESPA